MFQLRLILLVSLAVFLLDIGEIHDIAIFHIFIWTINPCKSLEQVMLLDYTMKIQFLEPRRIKSSLEHLEYYQQIDLSVLEQFNPFCPRLLVEAVICD